MASQLPLPLHPLHQLPKIMGIESSREVDDFIREARLALHLKPLDDKTAALWLIAALDGRARQEVIRLPVTEVDSPAKIFNILEENWGEQRDVVTLATAFFNRQQGQDETISEYGSHLQYLWRKVNQAGDGMLPATILRDTFTRGLRQAELRKDVRYFVRNRPATTFEEARKEAQRWMQDCSADNDILLHSAGTAAIASLQTQLEALTATVASLKEELTQPPARPPLQIRSCVTDAQHSGRRPRRRRRRKSALTKTGDKTQSFATVSSQNADKSWSRQHGPAAPRPPQVAVAPRLRVWPCQATSVPGSRTDTLPSSKPPDWKRPKRRKLGPPSDLTDRQMLPQPRHRPCDGLPVHSVQPLSCGPDRAISQKDLLPASAPLDLRHDDQAEVTPSSSTSDSESDSEDEPVLYGIPVPRQAIPQLMPVTTGHPVPPPVPSPVRATGPPTPAPRRSTRLVGKPTKRYTLSARLDDFTLA